MIELVKALEKKFKEWAYAIHDKDPRSVSKLIAIRRDATVNVGDPKPVHIQGVIGASLANRETIAKYLDLPPQFIIEIKAVGTFLIVFNI